MSADKKTQAAAKNTTKGKKADGFTDDEKAAMQERNKELKAEARRKSKANKAEEDEKDCLAKIAEMPEADRVIAERIHAIVKANAPDLAPKTWYGMPAYANKDGKIVCFFTPGQKFNERYATLGFNTAANLDDGSMWPTAFAVLEITPAVEERITALVKKAAS